MFPQKMLVTGANGFVGARIMAEYPQAIPVPRQLLREDREHLSAFIQEHAPDVIIHTAAISDIGTCEKNSDASYEANVRLPVYLAEASVKAGAKLIAFSSDQVYTGCTTDGPYSEDTPLPSPANVYARHKLEAENRVLDIAPHSVHLRATWMYDMPLYSHRNRGNFLANTLQTVLRGEPLLASSLQHRGITYVRQVAALLEGATHLPGGVYNYGSENELTMVETAFALLDALGLAEVGRVTDSHRSGHPLWMNTNKLRQAGLCFDTTAAGFRRCAEDYNLRW